MVWQVDLLGPADRYNGVNKKERRIDVIVEDADAYSCSTSASTVRVSNKQPSTMAGSENSSTGSMPDLIGNNEQAAEIARLTIEIGVWIWNNPSMRPEASFVAHLIRSINHGDPFLAAHAQRLLRNIDQENESMPSLSSLLHFLAQQGGWVHENVAAALERYDSTKPSAGLPPADEVETSIVTEPSIATTRSESTRDRTSTGGPSEVVSTTSSSLTHTSNESVVGRDSDRKDDGAIHHMTDKWWLLAQDSTSENTGNLTATISVDVSTTSSTENIAIATANPEERPTATSGNPTTPGEDESTSLPTENNAALAQPPTTSEDLSLTEPAAGETKEEEGGNPTTPGEDESTPLPTENNAALAQPPTSDDLSLTEPAAGEKKEKGEGNCCACVVL